MRSEIVTRYSHLHSRMIQTISVGQAVLSAAILQLQSTAACDTVQVFLFFTSEVAHVQVHADLCLKSNTHIFVCDLMLSFELQILEVIFRMKTNIYVALLH